MASRSGQNFRAENPGRTSGSPAEPREPTSPRAAKRRRLLGELQQFPIDFIADALLPPNFGAQLRATQDFVRRRAIMYADMDAFDRKDADARAALARLSRPADLPGRRAAREKGGDGGPGGCAGRGV